MRSSISIEILAQPELVFALVRDVTRWPSLLPHYVSAHLIAADPGGHRRVEFVARRPFVPVLGLGLPVAWRARCWAEPEHSRLRFEHLGGATAGMDVTWLIEPTPAGCRVTIEHDFSPGGPLGGIRAAITDRLFTRPIASRTLTAFRSIAEAVAATGLIAPESTGAPAANLQA
jgi:ribosome-associated toxin RatA of RatAB toxin-antitoxin module